MQVSLRSRISICHGLFNLTARGHLYPIKPGLTSFLAWLSANGKVLIKILLNFLLQILLDGKRGGNKGAFDKKASSETDLLILLFHNSSEDAFLLFLLYSPIISSCFCLFAAKLGVSVFGKDCNVMVT